MDKAKNVEIGFLNDYYGGLLTGYQSELVAKYYDEDLSLAEIASEFGITRQAVRDVITRSAEKLGEFEKKLGLAGKLVKITADLESIIGTADTQTAQRLQLLLDEIKEI